MKIAYTPKFQKQLKLFSGQVRDKLHKQVAFLVSDLRHPSLFAKKYDESQDIWQARVDRDIRFYFFIKDDTYVLLTITKHPK